MTVLNLVALGLTALILVPTGAHLFELPAKIAPDRDAYFAVQGVYAGWAWFGLLILAAVAANGALFLSQRHRDPKAACAALASSLLILIGLTIFFTWVFPANLATTNWTDVSNDWQALRRQ